MLKPEIILRCLVEVLRYSVASSFPPFIAFSSPTCPLVAAILTIRKLRRVITHNQLFRISHAMISKLILFDINQRARHTVGKTATIKQANVSICVIYAIERLSFILKLIFNISIDDPSRVLLHIFQHKNFSLRTISFATTSDSWFFKFLYL